MGHAEKVVEILADQKAPICDDCLALLAQLSKRQIARRVCCDLEVIGLVVRDRSSWCARCKKSRCCSVLIDKPRTFSTKTDSTSELEVVPPDANPWFWEGNVQAAFVSWLCQSGWSITQCVDTASKAPGVDVKACKVGVELWATVKGYPKGTGVTNPSTQARHWFSHAMMDVVLYRSQRSDIRIAVVMPDEYVTYHNFSERVGWLHDKAPFKFYWVGPDGSVREE